MDRYNLLYIKVVNCQFSVAILFIYNKKNHRSVLKKSTETSEYQNILVIEL